jgi:adenylate kinase family enzyme
MNHTDVIHTDRRGHASARLLRMKRVAVVGSGGVGKSTLADELGRRTGIPVVHLDQRFWKPGWVETARVAWVDVQRDIVAQDSWILDGNYGGTFDVRFARADTVIILTLPRWRCLLRAMRRSLRHLGQDIQAPGCRERLDFTFYRWVWRYPIDSRPRLDAALEQHREHLIVIELTTVGAMKAFIESVR